MDSLLGSDIMLMVLVVIGSAAIGYSVYTYLPETFTKQYTWTMYLFPIVGAILGVLIDWYHYSSRSNAVSPDLGL